MERDLAKLIEEDKGLAQDCEKLQQQLKNDRNKHKAARAELAEVKTRLANSTRQLQALEKTKAELEEAKKNSDKESSS